MFSSSFAGLRCHGGVATKMMRRRNPTAKAIKEARKGFGSMKNLECKYDGGGCSREEIGTTVAWTTISVRARASEALFTNSPPPKAIPKFCEIIVIEYEQPHFLILSSIDGDELNDLFHHTTSNPSSKWQLNICFFFF